MPMLTRRVRDRHSKEWHASLAARVVGQQGKARVDVELALCSLGGYDTLLSVEGPLLKLLALKDSSDSNAYSKQLVRIEIPALF
jgi:hypothetical protein